MSMIIETIFFPPTPKDFDDKVGIIRNELICLWIFSMYKLRRITHKLNIKPFGLYSVCECFAGIYRSINSGFTLSLWVIRRSLHIDKLNKNEIHSYN